MIRYSLDLKIEPFPVHINFDDKIVLLGSCFTEHIGKRLNNFHFDILAHPNGVVFNPISLAEPIKRMLDKVYYSKDDLVFHNNQWQSLFHHGRFADASVEDCLEKINQEQSNFEKFISSANWLFITFGTAWVYEYKNRGWIVANCHKIPQQQFTKKLLKPAEIVDAWKHVSEGLMKINPALKIIYTVSPVRHLRDGVHENNLSKATLLLAIQELIGTNQFYFPAYELVVDDLRDYRFFESDTAHPNEMAIDYVFGKFRGSVFSKECNEIMDDLDKYFKLRNHRPLHPTRDNLNDLSNILLQMKIELISKYPKLKEVEI